MTVKERILTIRLMEKLKNDPAYAATLGVEAAGAAEVQNTGSDPKGLTSV